MEMNVKAWVEKITIPTYPTGIPDKNPMFLEKRVYQGSSGKVYPHPVIDKICDTRINKEYTAVFIENQYLKIMVLPQLGGRIHRAFDKIRQRDFIYYNHVIKPALVGLTGPWISGGIEFNWPQHHRPSTFDPVDFSITDNYDGSKTVWVNEVELMTRTKGMAGFTLYPDKAYVEVRGRIFNRSAFPQSFLWWANPAVKVNDDYQSVFPADVTAVFDHGKRDVSDFPIATGTYYKVDYSPGTDISRYKNIPVPTSYMAIHSEYDFIGGYENDTQAGMLHVADHHFSPGKKQWTWGKGDFGVAWDRNLTDEDGPYIELMCGVYTDNQPDFSWLQPNEEKTFEQYFMPYAEIGIVKNATKEAAVNIELINEIPILKVYVTSVYPDSLIRISDGSKVIFEKKADLSPDKIFQAVVRPVQPDLYYKLDIFDSANKLLVEFENKKNDNKLKAEAASPAGHPSEIKSNELLFLTGLHLEQYRHATYDPTDYYLEGIKRDHGDSRCNNAMGLYLLRRAQFSKARLYLQAAIDRLEERNPNPYDGEPYYNMGMCLMMMGKYQDAYDSFYKSAWNDAWQHSGFFQAARIKMIKNKYDEALYLINKSIVKNGNSHSARHLKGMVLRKMGSNDEAKEWIDQSLAIDPFNYGCLFELFLLTGSQSIATKLTGLMENRFNNYAEYALDYIHCGAFSEAFQILKQFEDTFPAIINPLLYYYMGYTQLKMNDSKMAMHYFMKAADAKADYCFPSKIEEQIILSAAVDKRPEDAKGWYYLGNFWYANQQYAEALECWEKSATIDNSFPTVHRNLALIYFNKIHDVKKSIVSLETAFSLDTSDARVLMELNQLYKLLNYSPWERLQLLEDHIELVEERDDLYLERIILYNLLGDFETSLALLDERKFHPWEGGEGKVVGQYLLSITELAKQAMTATKYDNALSLLQKTKKYPHNLGEGKLPGTPENDIHYLEGIAYEKSGAMSDAERKFKAASIGNSEPAQAFFYNDASPDKIFYRGLAFKKLGEQARAEDIFNMLLDFGNLHQNDEIKIDYFAVSLPDLVVFDQDLNIKNKIHCLYLCALGNLGLDNKPEALRIFKNILELDSNHQGAIVHMNMI